jgi:2'-5' RNA ligase
MKKNRLFIAFKIPAEAADKLNTHLTPLFKVNNDKTKLRKLKNQHLTLAFLGDIEEDRIDELKDIINEAACCTKQIKTSFETKLDFFGSINKPRVLWLGLSNGRKEIISLAVYLKKLLQEHGFKADEKEYIPHLTLLRFKNNNSNTIFLREILNSKLDSKDNFYLDEIFLFKSRLDSRHAIHSQLYSAKLKT